MSKGTGKKTRYSLPDQGSAKSEIIHLYVHNPCHHLCHDIVIGCRFKTPSENFLYWKRGWYDYSARPNLGSSPKSRHMITGSSSENDPLKKIINYF